MTGRPSLTTATILAGVAFGVIGLLNVVLGTMSVISGAFPSAEERIVVPAVEVGSILFGMMMLAAGALWVASGVGYFMRKEWASTLALYVSPAIVAVNLAGVLHLWRFEVNIGWAALGMVAGVGGIWYLSKRELASFFLVSVAEHVVVIIVFAALIYAEPVDIAESRDDELLVTIEKIEPPEPIPPEVIPQKRTKLEKQPALPKIKIQDITATDTGTEIEDATPQLPKTIARIRDTGADVILRSPGLKEREQRYQSTVPALELESILRSSRKPSVEIGPSKRVKESSETTVARPPERIREESSRREERLGPSAEVAKPSFAGEITGEIAGRKVVFWPKPPEGYRGTGGGSAVIKFWVDPAGSVIKVEISKKSGSPRLDRMAMEYVKQIRFAELPKNVQQIVQWGKIPITFELTRGAE